MLKQTFLAEMKGRGGVELTNGFILFRKGWHLWNENTDEVINCKTPEVAFACDIGGMTVGDFVEQASMDIFTLYFDGGRGSGSGKDQKFKFGHASTSGNGESTPDFPARINVQVDLRKKSPEEVLNIFRKNHVLDKNESAVTVDPYGYVTQYVHGGATSVGIRARKNEIVYHNHPSGGAFSDSDLHSFALGEGYGCVASGKNGDYIIKKSNGFNAQGFSRAVKNAVLTGKNYDDAADKWLKKNQRKYGYKYEFKKAKR